MRDPRAFLADEGHRRAIWDEARDFATARRRSLKIERSTQRFLHHAMRSRRSQGAAERSDQPPCGSFEAAPCARRRGATQPERRRTVTVLAITASTATSMTTVCGTPPWTLPEGTFRQISATTSIEGCPGARLTVKIREPGVVVVSTSGGGQAVARYNPERDAYVGQFKWPAASAGRDSDVVVATAIMFGDGVLTVTARSRPLDFVARYSQ
jgi:hypothetical protein